MNTAVVSLNNAGRGCDKKLKKIFHHLYIGYVLLCIIQKTSLVASTIVRSSSTLNRYSRHASSRDIAAQINTIYRCVYSLVSAEFEIRKTEHTQHIKIDTQFYEIQAIM